MASFLAHIDIDALREVPRLLGLIGYPLSHSFSKRHFTEKFTREGISEYRYELFPLQNMDEFPLLLETFPNLHGLNVTIPYKQQVIPYLTQLDAGAEAIGAVNTIRFQGTARIGYNTDLFGFAQSLDTLLGKGTAPQPERALVFGTGGASKAVIFELQRRGIDILLVSRKPGPGEISYAEVDETLLSDIKLLINTTPLGMSPKVDTFPDIPYAALTPEHRLFDLVYNPRETQFLQRGAATGAQTQDGLPMLYGQAEKAWEIWNM
ncbi:MAG: shikimate dehydrogenase [Lewinellaceae bacterium]|nr:shikimate dehydrogenase [Lewinellaceae bacterium]